VCGRNLSTIFTSAASPRLDISCTCKVGQKLGVPLPLLTCSPSDWPSRLLYRRGRKSRRDLRITLCVIYIDQLLMMSRTWLQGFSMWLLLLQMFLSVRNENTALIMAETSVKSTECSNITFYTFVISA
jgi:hypothetical protein